ncbi:MAG: hypothetical protein BWY98_00650 [Tenericutes bacterium ADurb.BinA155]|nr:MAG: hypothetical protein BWY98_00650 [Tenericutes bacterium ADurb.BinA155]
MLREAIKETQEPFLQAIGPDVLRIFLRGGVVAQNLASVIVFFGLLFGFDHEVISPDPDKKIGREHSTQDKENPRDINRGENPIDGHADDADIETGVLFHHPFDPNPVAVERGETPGEDRPLFPNFDIGVIGREDLLHQIGPGGFGPGKGAEPLVAFVDESLEESTH